MICKIIRASRVVGRAVDESNTSWNGQLSECPVLCIILGNVNQAPRRSARRPMTCSLTSQIDPEAARQGVKHPRHTADDPGLMRQYVITILMLQ